MNLLAYSLAVDATNSGHVVVLKLIEKMWTFTVLILMLMAMAILEALLMLLCNLLIETRSSQKLNPEPRCELSWGQTANPKSTWSSWGRVAPP